METKRKNAYESYEGKIDLRSILEPYTKKELADLCRRHGLRKYYTWNKEEMVENLKDHLLRPDIMRSYFLCMSDDEVEYVRMTREYGGVMDDVEPDAYTYLTMGGYAGFTKDMTFGIPYEVLEVFDDFDDEEFDQKRHRISLIGDYSHVANYLYGVTPPMEVVKIFNLNEKKKTEWKEVIDVFYAIANYRCDFVYRDYYFVDIAFQDNYKQLLALQGDIPFYIPEGEQIQEWLTYGLSTGQDDVAQLYTFLMEKMWLSQETANRICCILESTVHVGCTKEDIYEILRYFGVETKTRKQKLELQILIEGLLRNTRMIIYRGHTSVEAQHI